MWPTLFRALAAQAWRLSSLLGTVVAVSDLIEQPEQLAAPVAVRAALATTLGMGLGFGSAVWVLTRNKR